MNHGAKCPCDRCKQIRRARFDQLTAVTERSEDSKEYNRVAARELQRTYRDKTNPFSRILIERAKKNRTATDG